MFQHHHQQQQKKLEQNEIIINFMLTKTKAIHKILALLYCITIISMFIIGVTGEDPAVPPPHTTPAPNDKYNCSRYSMSCDSCVHHSAHCYYCWKTNHCNVYPFTSLKPVPDDCGDSLSDLSWQTCAVRGNVIVIVFAILAGILAFIILSLLTWCCLIRPCVRKCNERDEAKWERNRLRLGEMQTQRRQERQQQRDNIRAKYGLNEPAYDKF